MLQTIIVLLLLLFDAALVQANMAALQSAIALSAPGMPGVVVTDLNLLIGIGAALVLVWLAGLADRAGIDRRIRQRDATLHTMGEELLKMKATAYDRERPALADIRARLEAMERDLRALRAHPGERTIGAKDREPAHVAGERRS